MKRLLLSMLILSFCLIGVAQKPKSFDYQAIVYNKAGKIVTSHNITLKFFVLKGSRCDTIVYSEKQSTRTNHFGSLNVTLGTGTEKNGILDSINWSADQYYLRVLVDPDGGSNYTDMGTTQILNSLKPIQQEMDAEPPVESHNGLFISRKYIGNYLDYRSTGTGTFNGVSIIWIKTTMDKYYGKFQAYGKKCDFTKGDRLYIRRKYYTPGGVSGYWMYQIENDSSVYYKLSEFQSDKKVDIETWFK